MMKKVFFVTMLGLLVFSNIAFASEYIGTLSAGGDANAESFPTPTFNGNTQAPANSQSMQQQLASLWNNFGWVILAAAIIVVLVFAFYRIARSRNPV